MSTIHDNSPLNKALPGDDDIVRLTIRVEERLRRKVKAHCAEQGATIQDWLITLIEEALPEQ